jgi:hypothetical protein
MRKKHDITMKKSFFLTAFLCRTDRACVLAISWDPGCSDDEIELNMFKTLNSMGPNSLKELFTFKTEILNHNLRDITQVQIRLPKPNTNILKKMLCTMELLSGTPYHNI